MRRLILAILSMLLCHGTASAGAIVFRLPGGLFTDGNGDTGTGVNDIDQVLDLNEELRGPVSPDFPYIEGHLFREESSCSTHLPTRSRATLFLARRI
jgi:hypothetical protein